MHTINGWKYCAGLLTCAFCVPALGKVPTAEWLQTTGPAGGSITAFGGDGNSLYAAVWLGGVFRSTNGGLTWTRAATGLPTAAQVAELAIIDGIVFAGTSDQGLFRSFDDGQTWSPVGGSLPVDRVRLLIVRDQDLFALVDSPLGTDLYRSTDLADTWTHLPAATGFHAAAVEGAVLLGNSTAGIGFFRSVDEGQTWESPPSTGLTTGVITQLTQAGGAIYGASSSVPAVLCKTTDGGDSWSILDPGGLDNVHRLDSAGSALYVSANESTALFRSLDAGENWQDVAGGLPHGQGRQVNAVAEHLGTHFAATEKGVFRSSDQGDHWQDSDTGLVGTRIRTLISSGETLFASVAHLPNHAVTSPFAPPASLDIVYRSHNAGATWTILDNGLPSGASVGAIVRTDSHLLVGTVQHGVFRSGDDGDTWTPAGAGLPQPYNAPGEIEALVWTGSALFAATQPRSLFFDHAQNRIQGGGVYRSLDQGLSWSPANAGLPLQGDNNPPFSYPHHPFVTSLAFVGGTLLLGTEDLGIFRSTGSAPSWASANAGLPVDSLGRLPQMTGFESIGGDMLASSRGFSSGDPTAAGVYRSSDAGMSWSLTSQGLPTGRPVTALATDCARVYASVGCQAYTVSCTPDTLDGVYVSEDGGFTWESLGTGLQGIEVSPLAVQGLDLFAGTLGAGVWSLSVATDCNANAVADHCEAMHDYDFDCDVDVLDFSQLQRCAAPGFGPGCRVFDTDDNQSIDLIDYAAFAAALTGPS